MVLFLAALLGVSSATSETLTGTALIRERIALPPDAVFEAVIEDIARPGAPVTVHVEGGLALRPSMEGPPRTSLIVDRFIAVRPDEACRPAEPQASLTDTYLRIDTLMNEAMEPQQNRREPHIVLQSGPDRRFRATVGCNQVIGRFDVDGTALTFAAAASTMMACPPPLDAAERRLRDALAATRAFSLQGQSLVLQDAGGRALAELAAVDLR